MGTFAETSIVVYRIICQPRKMMSVSVCSKQTKACCFHFRLQKTNGIFRFPFAEFEKRAGMDMETWRDGNMETWTRRHQTENGSPGDFP
jgi:hypothetical protein